jgi:hypothetical protein
MPVVGVLGGGGGAWTTVGVLATVGVDAGRGVAVVFARRGGAGRGLSAGVGMAFSRAGSDARAAGTATGEASEVAVCRLEPDLVAMPTPNAAANPKTAATAALSGAALLNLDISQLVVGAMQIRAAAVVAARPVAVGDRGHLLVGAVSHRAQNRADA